VLDSVRLSTRAIAAAEENCGFIILGVHILPFLTAFERKAWTIPTARRAEN
jgi:hypothetical protein